MSELTPCVHCLSVATNLGEGVIDHAWTLDDSDWIQVVRGARQRLS